MTNDVTTALELLAEGQANTIDEWVKTKQKELSKLGTKFITLCTMEKPCLKCVCLFCGYEIPVLPATKNNALHDKCYYQILIDEVIS